MLQDPDFGYIQQLGTCVESSANAVEKFLFPNPSDRKILKKIHIRELEAYRKRYEGSIFPDIQKLNALADQKLGKLQGSINPGIGYDEENQKYFQEIDIAILLENGFTARHKLRIMASSKEAIIKNQSEREEFLDQVTLKIKGLIQSGGALPPILLWDLDKDQSRASASPSSYGTF